MAPLETRPPAEGSTDAMAPTLRRWIISQSLASDVGHVGSALSIVEILAALFGQVLRDPGSSHPDRDRFILSKGHAALALYAALRYQGLMSEESFGTFCADGSLLGVHPEHGLPGVEFSTGSLGLGLSIGAGLAFGLRARGSPARVFTLLSDAELNEGQVWEAALFAAHHRLEGLRVIVDWNGLQAMGATAEILAIPDPVALWRAWGWWSVEVDGHDETAIASALAQAPQGCPAAVMARTVLGKGVSFMEGRLEWHYRNLTEDLARQALAEIDGAPR